MSRCLLLIVPLCLVSLALADGLRDNIPEKVRPIPPAGIAIPQRLRDDLTTKLAVLTREVAELPAALKGKAGLLELMPDVEIYEKAVRWALRHGEVYSPAELEQAGKLIEIGRQRAEHLRIGQPTWTRETGLIVRGYRSRIDGSAQPYGLVVPASYRSNSPHRHRLDLWLHGRGETLTELNFIVGRQKSAGEFTPKHAFVLHPYGRYCNAFKFAGEIDVLDALDHARKHYSIDDRRVVMRGFSMGGAGCWNMAIHYPDRWVAAAPGAGFSETPLFLKFFQKETLAPTWFEKKLWQLHDCPGWVGNFRNLPVVAYSGADDIQKQAADVMAEAFRGEGMELVHLIGPKTGHGYHPQVREELNHRIDQIAEKGQQRVPRRVRFVTYSLRYKKSFWVQLDGLEEHWRQARIDASILSGVGGNNYKLGVTTNNISAFTISFEPGDSPFLWGTPRVSINKDDITTKLPPVKSDRSWSASFVKSGDGWKVGKADPATLCKKHGLQGPIDDAFLDSFLMVRPTGQPWHAKTGQWAKAEMAHAIDQWRKQFRGDARVMDDTAITAADIAQHNLVLWGDPGSNAVMKKILAKLPIGWDEKQIRIGTTTWAGETHTPLLIYPNPLNPARYVVLNSGFTMREYEQLNNARQVPKLPDWAVIDIRVPPSSQWPGKVVGADFFDEAWKVRAKAE